MRNASALIATHVIGELVLFIRNILLARFLGPADMGVAAMLAMTLRLAEMASDCSVDRLLVQAVDGNRPRFQRVAQGLQIVRGLLSGIVLASFSAPIATVFGQPDAATTFACLGIIPVIKGFAHLDYKRLQRRLTFTPAAAVEISSATLAVMSCIPAILLLPDYRAVLVVGMVHSSATVIASHLSARRRFAVGWNRQLTGRMIRFGIPLAANGLLMFGVFQGDRFIVAVSFSAEELGRYAIASQFCLIPVLVINRIANAYFLPVLSRRQGCQETFLQQLGLGLVRLTGASVLLACVFVLAGNTLLQWLYGAEYGIPESLLLCLVLMQVLRLFRTMQSTASVAMGNTVQPLVVNLFRSLGLLGAAVAAWLGFGITAIAAAGCAGEVLAIAVAGGLLKRRYDIPLGLWLPSGVITIAGLVLSFGLSRSACLPIASYEILLLIAIVLFASQWKVLNSLLEDSGRLLRSR